MNGEHQNGLSALYERFRDYESDSRVVNRTVADVPVWSLIRVAVFSENLLPRLTAIGAAHPDLKDRRGVGRPPSGILSRLRSLKDRLLYSPTHSLRSYEVLFALTPRQMRLADGREVAQMLDFFLPKLKCTSAVLESRRPGDPYPPRPGWQRVFHLDGHAGQLRAFLRSKRDVAAAAAAYVAELTAELKDAFGVALDADKMTRMVIKAVCVQLFYGPLFRACLRRLKVRCVVTVVHYSLVNQVLCASAHAEGIPVVELQHGTVYPAHPAYNPIRYDHRYAPDYLFAWGRHWVEQTRQYALCRTVCTGYPALEYLLEHNPPRPKCGKRKIVFISQGTIGGDLSQRAVALRKLLPDDEFEIVYKLHPNESKTWRDLYPWLQGAGVEVVSSAQVSVYELFRDAAATVGVYSTAVIESLMWNLKGYVFGDLPGGDTMAPFLREGVLENVTSPEDLAGRLKRGDGVEKETMDGLCFWQPHASENIVAALQEIVEKGELK